MNLVTTEKPRNLVRADSEEAKEGFRSFDDDDRAAGQLRSGSYVYFVPMDGNSAHLLIKRKGWIIQTSRKETMPIKPEYVLVFNLRYNIAGLVKADEMVEPVNLTVNIGEKE